MMRSISPVVFRVGKFDRGENKVGNIADTKSRSQLQESVFAGLKGILNFQFNVAIVQCQLVASHSSKIVIHVVGYKYIQRARLAKTQRLALLIATGVFKNKPPLYYVRASQGFMLPMHIVGKLEQMLGESFGKSVQLYFHNISNIANSQFGKLDHKVYNQLQEFIKSQNGQLEKTKGDRSGPPIESKLESVGMNPMKIRDSYYPYKAFSALTYSLDVIMSTVYSSMYNLSSLYADVIIHGLLRNMKRHKQFLALVETSINHFRSFNSGPFKPVDGFIAVHGKIGSGTIRSRSLLIKTRDLPLQTLSFPVNYTYRNADTKYGSIGVKIGMRKSF